VRRPRTWPWPRLPRRTARLRLTVLYAAAFLACGAAVLAVVTYLLFRNADVPSSSLPTGSVSALFNAKVPASDVREAGRYDILNNGVRVPVADVQQRGRYDIINVPIRASSLPQGVKPPVLSASQRATLLSEEQSQVHYDKVRILVISASALAVIAVAAAAIGWIIAGRVLRPLSTITAAARRIAASNLHERLALQGPDDELKELADTLDSLLARLEASFDAQRRFAANASHELRTPLTRERALLQVTLADPDSSAGTWRAVGRQLLAANGEQERLIEALLALARGEADANQRETVNLATITNKALAVPRPEIARLGLHLGTDIQPAILHGEALLVQQLVTNLIDNAVRHNIADGDVQVATRTSDGHAVLTVTNSGQVIPPAEVDRLFQPFQRLGPRAVRADGGHGLGLSIVRTIATAHGAAVTAQPRPGGGLAIDVTFAPATPEPRRSGRALPSSPGERDTSPAGTPTVSATQQ